MPSDEGLLTRLIAGVKALLPKDWTSRPGAQFRETTRAISDFAEEHHLTPAELLESGVELGRRKIEGLANHEFAEAARNFADAERIKTETELQRRTAESKVSRKEAKARKAHSDARLAEINAVRAEIELLEKLQSAGVILHSDSEGRLTVLPLPRGCELTNVARRHQLTDNTLPSHLLELSDGVHVIRDYSGPIILPDKVVIVEAVAVVGDIEALQVTLRPGSAVTGNMHGQSQVSLQCDARLTGDITTERASIEDGAYFKGGIDIRKPQ